MKFKLAVLPGDGIGPEVVTEGVKVLQAIGKKFGHQFDLHYGLIGGIAIDKSGEAFSKEMLKMCQSCQAVMLGAVGGPKWDDPKAKTRPEDGLLAIRKGLGLFANLRPVHVFPELVNSTNFKPEVIDGVDFIVVRELTGGLYFGRPKRQWTTTKGRRAVDTMSYSEMEIERILRVGFELARRRKKKLNVDPKYRRNFRYRRRKEEINARIAQLMEVGLSGLATRFGAWCAGYISDDDLDRDIESEKQIIIDEEQRNKHSKLQL